MPDYIPRDLTNTLTSTAEWYPIVSLTGPRQSGKSTLLKHAFPHYKYINLENPQLRASAREDPISFIKNHSINLIIDEAQYAPALFSVIQEVSDQRNTPGQYILSGSQNFLLMHNIQQSLAGRVGILKLLPFSYGELKHAKIEPPIEDFILKGGYPRTYTTRIPPHRYYSDYLQTYVERDVADLLDIRNKPAFRQLLIICAQQAGCLLNITSLARAVGVSAITIKSWLTILESSYLIFMLRPFHANIKKRLTKTPKLYFHDTGLLCALLRINSVEALERSPLLGQVFENLIVSSTVKKHLNQGKVPDLYFYRDDSKREIDLLDFTDASQPIAVEIKASRTYQAKYAHHLKAVGDELGISNKVVIARVEGSYNASSCRIESAQNWLFES